MALLLWRRHYGHLLSRHALKTLWQRGALKRFFTVNRDIFFRTLCLVGVTSCFTAFGTAMGDATLAANTLLMQFFVLFSYIMDGFAYAGEALGGRYVGEGNEGSFRRLTKSLFLWGAALVGLYSLVYVAGGESFLRLLTNDASVVAAALPYLPLACAIPVVSAAAFIFDGLFIGATATRQMPRSRSSPFSSSVSKQTSGFGQPFSATSACADWCRHCSSAASERKYSGFKGNKLGENLPS